MSDEIKKAVDEWFAAMAGNGLPRRMTDEAWPKIAEHIRQLQFENERLRAANDAFNTALALKGDNQ